MIFLVAVYYRYTAYSGSGGNAVIQTPPPGSTLSGDTVTFTWTSPIEATLLWVGTSQGSGDIYNSENATSPTTVTNLPANGALIYVRRGDKYQVVAWCYGYVSGP